MVPLLSPSAACSQMARAEPRQWPPCFTCPLNECRAQELSRGEHLRRKCRFPAGPGQRPVCWEFSKAETALADQAGLELVDYFPTRGSSLTCRKKGDHLMDIEKIFFFHRFSPLAERSNLPRPRSFPLSALLPGGVSRGLQPRLGARGSPFL